MKLCSENGEPITDNHFLIQLAPWNLQLLFSENGGPLTFNVVFISAQRKAGFVASWGVSASLTSPDAPPGITSWDVLPSLTSRRSRPRLLPKAALRPGTIFAGIASHLTSDWLSLFSRERSEPLHKALSRLSMFAREAELASPKARLAFAKQRLARRSLTGFQIASCRRQPCICAPIC